MSSRTGFRRARAALAVVLAGAALVSSAAVALQQQVIGGHALDANLRVDGSGFNTSSGRSRVSGLQSSAYSPSRATRSAPGLSSPVYQPRGYDPRTAGGVAIETGSGTFTAGRGGGRVDPLRNPQYSVLQTGAYVQRGARPGVGPTASYTRVMATPKTPQQAYRMSGVSKASRPSTGLQSTRYSVARARR